MSVLRARWAAVGAAVAVTLGAGGLAAVSATAPAGAATFVPITPCRLFDTRPEFLVGARSTPMTKGETWTVQVTGSNGNCKNIPADATAIAMNVTADLPSELTFLTVWPAGDPLPNTSSLNPTPGKPSPNEVNTRLGTGGKVSIYNKLGTVNVLADITGYYVDHNHDDRYYTKSQVDARTPLASTVSVGSADFLAVGPGSAERGISGGVYPSATTASNALVAGVEIPNGATITGITAEFIDGDTTQDMEITLRCESLGTANVFFPVAPLKLTGDAKKWTSAVATAPAPPTTVVPSTTVPTSTSVGATTSSTSSSTTAPTTVAPGAVVNNQLCAYQVFVLAPTWSAAAQATAPLQIGAVHIDYKMPS